MYSDNVYIQSQSEDERQISGRNCSFVLKSCYQSSSEEIWQFCKYRYATLPAVKLNTICGVCYSQDATIQYQLLIIDG